MVPALVTVDSAKLTLNDGETSYDADPSWQATCPTGYTVVGTGFNAGGIGQVGFVISYGTFVGGFVSNDNGVSVQDAGIYLQAICGVVPGGSSGADARDVGNSASARYKDDLRQAQREHDGGR